MDMRKEQSHQVFLYNSSAYPRGDFCPLGGIWQYGDIFGCLSWGGGFYWHAVG